MACLVGNDPDNPLLLAPGPAYAKEMIMWTLIAAVLIVIWLMGLVTTYALDGFAHLLLIVAIVMVLMRIIQRRRPI
ncbi:MAG: hypothetical protein AMXMBFR83_08860 [Phycisphaerae bacterium]|jgi:hypothetical protein